MQGIVSIIKARMNICTYMTRISRYVRTGNCEERLAYVCSTNPLYAQPDYPCPNGFYSYRNTCLYPELRLMPYDQAQTACALRGALILPIKNIEMHLFVAAWVPGSGTVFSELL
jgi:hypothetical protein